MPLDPSIALAARSPVQLADPLSQYARVAQIKGMMDQSQLAGLQRQALQNQLTEHDRVLAAFNNLQPGQSVESILPQVYQASPQTGIALQKNLLEAKQAQSTIAKNTAVATATKIGTYRDMLGPVNDQASYDQWRQGFTQDFPQFAQSVPPTFSPDVKNQLLLKGDALVKAYTPNMQKVQINDGQKTTTQFVDTNPITNPGVKDLNIVTQMQATPGEVMSDKRARELNGLIENGQLSGNLDEMAKGIASYRLAPLSGFALRSPAGQRIMGMVMQQNPDYNAQNYASSQKAYNAFTSGQQGNAVRSFSVATSHLDTLSRLADALQNGDTKVINKVANAYKEQTGSPAPVNFDAAKQIVGDEITKAIIGAGGGVGDREKAQAAIAAANSPAQLKGVIETYKELMAGQLGGLKRQYEQGTMRKDFNRFLSPEAQAQLEKHFAGAQTPAAAAPAVGDPTVVQLPNGKAKKFPDAASATAFRKEAGL